MLNVVVRDMAASLDASQPENAARLRWQKPITCAKIA
jgi:hypothetical protein